MSYSISISGHGASEETVRKATQQAVDALGVEGSVYGSYSGSDSNGQSFDGASGMTPTPAETADPEGGES